MTDTPRRNSSARALIVLLALGLVVMLAASLKERFENPHLTVFGSAQRTVAHDAGGMGTASTDDAQAIGTLMRQVADNPQDLTALIHLIEHLVAAQNWQAAETFAQRAVTMDLKNPTPLYLLGVILHNEGRHKEAAQALESVLALKDEASVRYSLGVLYIHFLGDPKRGVENLIAGLTDPDVSEELKAAIRQELEKAPKPEPAPGPSGSKASDAPGPQQPAPTKKSGRKTAN